MPEGQDIYRGLDPGDLPLYSLAEASSYLRLPPATLRSWVAGRSYPKRSGKAFFTPLIALSDAQARRLSFVNLIEAHVLKALRTRYSIPVKAVRNALDYAQEHLGIDRLLISPELKAGAGDVFLEHYGQLINLSKSGQLALKRVLDRYLQRVEWDLGDIPVRLYPFAPAEVPDDSRVIVIDPRIGFGRPIIARKGITTGVITERIDAGEDPAEVAADYDLTMQEVDEALMYELAA